MSCRYDQQDVGELYDKLLDELEKLFKDTKQDGLIKALFQGKTKSFLSCRCCDYENNDLDKFLKLTVLIRGSARPLRPMGPFGAIRIAIPPLHSLC